MVLCVFFVTIVNGLRTSYLAAGNFFLLRQWSVPPAGVVGFGGKPSDKSIPSQCLSCKSRPFPQDHSKLLSLAIAETEGSFREGVS